MLRRLMLRLDPRASSPTRAEGGLADWSASSTLASSEQVSGRRSRSYHPTEQNPCNSSEQAWHRVRTATRGACSLIGPGTTRLNRNIDQSAITHHPARAGGEFFATPTTSPHRR